MNNVNGILLVIASMLAFTIEDTFIKKLSASVSTGQILIVLGVICGFVFLIMALVTRRPVLTVAAWRPLPLIRASCEAVGALTFVTALALVDLSTVAAVFQSLPLAITMGAAVFLREHVGWRRWSAIVVGFIGVLLIIRPGLEGFQPESLFVVAAVMAVATRDLITRRIDPGVSSAVVSLQAYLAVIVAGGLLMIFTAEPIAPLQSFEVWPYLGAAVFSVLGYYAIVSAMRVGEASAVTPFRYTRLLFSLVAGIMVFEERPDAPTLAGAALIIGSGLYTFLRERRLARQMSKALT